MNRIARNLSGASGAARTALRSALLCSLAGAAPAAAQLTPVEFNHGFANQGSAWVPTADYLRQRFQIETLTPTTPFRERFDHQSVVLADALNTWGRNQVVGMSHSNGGIVARNYTHLYGSASRINRLTTVGTPHQGASIAQNMINGRVINYFGSMAASIGFAFDFYANHDPAWHVTPVVDVFTQNAFAYIHYLGVFLANTSALSGFGIASYFPVTQDEVPGSSWITQFNSSANLAVESSVLQRRVGVATQVPPNGALFRLVSSDPRGWRRVQAVSASAALALYFHYSYHPNWWLAAHATYWLDVYWYITLIDVAWHDFIGAIKRWYGPIAVVWQSDGFIPHWSTQFPNASSQYNMYLPAYNISHNEQLNHPSTRARYEEILSRDFNIPRRTSTYNPPPYDGGEPCEPTGTQVTCAV